MSWSTPLIAAQHLNSTNPIQWSPDFFYRFRLWFFKHYFILPCFRFNFAHLHLNVCIINKHNIRYKFSTFVYLHGGYRVSHSNWCLSIWRSFNLKFEATAQSEQKRSTICNSTVCDDCLNSFWHWLTNSSSRRLFHDLTYCFSLRWYCLLVGKAT